jgi:hypothetical protein
LRWWDLTIHWHKKGEKSLKKSDKAIDAWIYADWKYATASLHINLDSFSRMGDKDIESVIIHELCHALVNEMREGEMHHEERVVTGLAKAFIWTERITKSKLKK